MSYSVKDTYTFLSISRSSLHNWTDNLAEFMSLSATDSSAARRYNDEDIIVLWTCKILRDSGLGFPEIIEQLKTGFRVDPDTRPGDDTLSISVTPKEEIKSLQLRLKQYESQIEELEHSLQKKEHDIIRVQAERDLLKDLIEQYIRRDDK
jgi:DNA-binding transcriptional MerR regulator